METSISQKLPVSSILFFIYINGLFDAMSAIFLQIIFFIFMDDLEFFASKNLIQKVVTSLEKTREAVFK